MSFLENEYSFLFESPCSDETAQEKKILYADKAEEVFTDLATLDEFIAQHYQKFKNSNAGIAGYYSYEGQMEFAFYENIHSSQLKIETEFQELQLILKQNYQKLKLTIVEDDPKEFIRSILKCQEYISEGDIYQANLCREFLIQSVGEDSSASNLESLLLLVYSKLRLVNPAPYAGFMNYRNYGILSSSPESFLRIYNSGSKIRAGQNSVFIASSPIKGTAKLSEHEFLKNSAKDHAEHIMIVDLERNDLGRICKPSTIEVEQLMQMHKFNNLYHYISTIVGELKEELYENGLRFSSIFQACFPSGSITGAPKIRAMEIIQELEHNPRGPYTGTMGYWKFNGEGEFNILIRSIIADKLKQKLSFHTGCGITANSIPELELAESYLKAENLYSALGL